MIRSSFKDVLCLLLPLLLVVSSGCQISASKSPATVRGAELAGEWRMAQLLLSLEAGDESLVLLRLADRDKVDGYFFLEKGSAINFQIAGNSLIYESRARDAEALSKVTSDRFSFVASQAQGNTYTLTFRNPDEDEKTKAVVFLEVIYPVGGTLFLAIERK